MDRCPELFELEAFFEVPAVAAYGCEGGWYYDSLRFIRSVGGERVVCKLEPAEGTFSIFHSEGGDMRFDVSLQSVCSLELQASAGAEVLIGRVSHGGVEQLFKLSLKPRVSFQMGTACPSFE